MSKIDVIYDIEVKENMRDNRWIKPRDMEVSVVCAYRSDKDVIETFWEGDLKKLEELFNLADRIIGFNSWRFDEPVLGKYFSSDISIFRSIDMLEAVKKTIGYRIKLEKLARATLKTGKLGTGVDALRFWAQGNLKDLEEYCRQDVVVTRDLFYHGENIGKLAYFNGFGEVTEFKIDWSTAEREGKKQSTLQQSLL